MYSEITLTSPDGASIRKYWLVSEDVYQRNKTIARLINQVRDLWGEYPLFELFEHKYQQCYNS